jgi:hypothetical protein
MRQFSVAAAIPAVLLLASCGGQQSQPADTAAELTPGTVVREAQFGRPAPALLACAAVKANKGSNMVLGDLGLVTESYPKVELPPADGGKVFVAMEMANKADLVPLWVMTGRELTAASSYVELRMGYSPKAGKARAAELWQLLETCSEQKL